MGDQILAPSVSEGEIPQAAAEIPESLEAPEAQIFSISFRFYRTDLCCIDSFDPKIGRKSLRAIKDLGLMESGSTEEVRNNLETLKIKPVSDDNSYQEYYNKLRNIPDLEIYEAITERDTGRMYFFIINTLIYLVAIRGGTHTETKKQKRRVR